MTCSPSESTRLFHKVYPQRRADACVAPADPATSFTYMRIHSTCTRILLQNFPVDTSPQMSISPLQVQTAPLSVCPSEVSFNLVTNAVNHFLTICPIPRSLRQVQDAQVSCTPQHGTDDDLFFNFPYTCRGRKVTSLGVLYDFTGNDHNTTVQKVEDMVKEAWVSCIPCLYLYLKG